LDSRAQCEKRANEPGAAKREKREESRVRLIRNPLPHTTVSNRALAHPNKLITGGVLTPRPVQHIPSPTLSSRHRQIRYCHLNPTSSQQFSLLILTPSSTIISDVRSRIHHRYLPPPNLALVVISSEHLCLHHCPSDI